MEASEQLPDRLAWRSHCGDWFFVSTTDSLALLLASLPLPCPSPESDGNGEGATSPVHHVPIRLGNSRPVVSDARMLAETWKHLIVSDAGIAAWAWEWLVGNDGANPEDPCPPAECERELLERLARWTSGQQLLAIIESFSGQVVSRDVRAEAAGELDASNTFDTEHPAERDVAWHGSMDGPLLRTMASAYAREQAWERQVTGAGERWRPCEAEALRLRRQRAAQRLAEASLHRGSNGTPDSDARSVPSVADALRVLLARVTRLESLERDYEEQLRRAKLAALRELAYGASHEINNPLANIASRAQLLVRDEDDPQRRRSLATIHGQAMRAHEMIADMMLFAKPPRPQPSRVALADAVRAWAERLRARLPVAMEFHCEVTVDHAVDYAVNCPFHGEVQLDRDQAGVAWDAIARNAIEAMEERGRLVVRIELTRAGGTGSIGNTDCWAWVVFQDTGPGLSDRAREHLFDPFFSGREAGRGLGFGLSKAWRIAELHGGAIEVHSTDTGVIVHWGLPCVKDPLRPGCEQGPGSDHAVVRR